MPFIAQLSTTLPDRATPFKAPAGLPARAKRSSCATIILASDLPVSPSGFPGQGARSLAPTTTPPLPPPQSAGLPPALLSEPRALGGYVPRCTEKGCVFPQARPGGGKCRQHERQFREPDLFTTRQPSVLLLDRAKFDFPESGFEEQEARANDRRNLAKLWRTFQDGA